MQMGTVKFYNTQKGYGFIQPDAGGKDVFVHATALERAGINGLREGQKVRVKGRAAVKPASDTRRSANTARIALSSAPSTLSQVSSEPIRFSGRVENRISKFSKPCSFVVATFGRSARRSGDSTAMARTMNAKPSITMAKNSVNASPSVTFCVRRPTSRSGSRAHAHSDLVRVTTWKTRMFGTFRLILALFAAILASGCGCGGGLGG